LLRERPSMLLKQIVENEPTIDPMLADRHVAERLASYNMLAVGVCDSNGRLLGAVTVDDVLDNALPADWRRKAVPHHPSGHDTPAIVTSLNGGTK